MQDVPFFGTIQSRAWIMVRRIAHTAHHRAGSCGRGRECVSAWSAQAAVKLHQRLGDLDEKYAIRIEAPGPPRGAQPTLF
jgi:hypothetical protein